MQKHLKNLMDGCHYFCEEEIMCEITNVKANDAHHIVSRSHQGSDKLANIMSLVRNKENKEFHKNGNYDWKMYLVHEHKKFLEKRGTMLRSHGILTEKIDEAVEILKLVIETGDLNLLKR